MNLANFRRPRVADGSAVTAVLVSALLVIVSTPSLAQTPRDKYDQMRQRQTQESRFALFAEPTLVLDVNDYQCGLRNQGDTCSDVFNSPTGGGGFWPTGSANQYMFNSGLNLAGIIPADAGFAWAGDTTGAYFFDARGTQQHGEGITQIFNSLDADDVANWPDFGSIPDFPEFSGYVLDDGVFNEVLLGRPAASQQDSWLLYWDGNPAQSANRTHPMGITVQQRTMAWNFPEGNEATIYFVYQFTNVTNNALFQSLNEVQFFGGENRLPDEGWRIDSIYVSFDVDPDVTADFDKNYSTAILPFDMGVAYEGEFQAADFTYFPDIFRPPFFTNAPGLVGVKYLRSPIDPTTNEEVGLTLFTVHENPSSPGAIFFDPFGIQQLWRYLSGNIRPELGDPPCTFTNPKQRRLCFLAQTPKDTRFLQASGPFSLEPGETQTVVVAQFAAATVETPLIELGNTAANNPGTPSLRPGCGGLGEDIRPIEIGAGWVSTSGEACSETPGVIDQFGVNVVPGSLLGKALVAQTIFDNKFLLGFAPEKPDFFLVAGNNQVTVVWEPSPTEDNGDPFFSAAGDPTNALFNPNYRQFDVEGYRVYRGTNPSNLRLLAQFDKAGSVFIDHSCETDATFTPGSACADAGPDNIPGTADDAPRSVDISSPFIQYPLGGVVQLADGSAFVTSADTALASRIAAGTARPMTNTGIPFSFVDQTTRNGFQYFYRVTAFDINSLKAGPVSLESAGDTKDVFPQRPASDLSTADFAVGLFGRSSEPLVANPPALDRVTGTFSGPQAPTTLLDGNFLPFAPNLLSTGSFEVRIDSIVPVYYSGEYFLTVTGQDDPVVRGSPDNFGLGGLCISGGSRCDFDLPPVSVPSDTDARQQLLNAGIEAPPSSGQLTLSLAVELPHWHAGDSDWAYTVPAFWEFDPPGGAIDGGSRWFSGDNETMPDPTVGLAHGALDGVNTIFQPVPFQGILAAPDLACNTGAVSDHMRRFLQSTWLARRGADIKVYWGAGVVDSVIDVTHDLPVEFSTHVRASYGFVTTDADASGVVDYKDFWFIPGLEKTSTISCASITNPAPLSQQPQLVSVDVDGDRAADGQGIAMYIAGEPYLFQLDALPQNTVWTYRAYNGIVSRDASGSYSYDERPRTPGVPGLRFALQVNSRAQIDPQAADLSQVHTVPDPYYAVSQFDLGPATKNLRFVNLPSRATIRIYTVSGILVDVINHNDPAGGGQATWDLRNRSNQFVASGVYFYHVTTPTGEEHIGKFTVVNFAN